MSQLQFGHKVVDIPAVTHMCVSMVRKTTSGAVCKQGLAGCVGSTRVTDSSGTQTSESVPNPSIDKTQILDPAVVYPEKTT